jgi:hypothetical protein
MRATTYGTHHIKNSSPIPWMTLSPIRPVSSNEGATLSGWNKKRMAAWQLSATTKKISNLAIQIRRLSLGVMVLLPQARL